ncbi:MAG: lipid-A-disaccharide synthase [Vicinamibacterales bacterium]
MISCGEPSGDLYAGALATEILRAAPGTTISGLGGDCLRDAGATLVEHFGGISVTGLLEVARVLPKTYATYRRLVQHAAAERPDVFVAIDFPDFNFRLARAVRKLGIPVVYYISPQLWAWRPGRMKTMRAIADRVLVIFEFEKAIYEQAGVPVDWVGHPLLDVMVPPEPAGALLQRVGLDPSHPVVALLPGSRRNELREILPGLVEAARLIRTAVPDVQFVVARAPHLSDDLFAPLAALGPVGIVDGQADQVLAAADLAIVASGTVTVQAALHECPMIVVYRLSPLTYRLGRRFVRVDTFAMANLVAGRRVVPELIQNDFTPDAVANHAIALLRDPVRRDGMRRDLQAVRAALGPPGASARAAGIVLNVGARAAMSRPT